MAAKAVKAPVLGAQKKADLPVAVFGEGFHESLVDETARADLAARRRGTASTLGRSQVSMTTAKAWRQKGTGRARVGALSAPHRRGGGVAFGPKPRNHAVKVNRKARRRALRSALSMHATRDSVAVLDAGGFDAPSTKRAVEALEKWGARRPTLVVIGAEEVAALKSFRNLPRVTVLPASAVGVVDIVRAASLVISQEALKVLEARTAEVKRGAAGASDEVAVQAAKPAARSAPKTAETGRESGGSRRSGSGREAEEAAQ